jgi:hypothetical protein
MAAMIFVGGIALACWVADATESREGGYALAGIIIGLTLFLSFSVGASQ